MSNCWMVNLLIPNQKTREAENLDSFCCRWCRHKEPSHPISWPPSNRSPTISCLGYCHSLLSSLSASAPSLAQFILQVGQSDLLKTYIIQLPCSKISSSQSISHGLKPNSSPRPKTPWCFGSAHLSEILSAAAPLVYAAPVTPALLLFLTNSERALACYSLSGMFFPETFSWCIHWAQPKCHLCLPLSTPASLHPLTLLNFFRAPCFPKSHDLLIRLLSASPTGM